MKENENKTLEELYVRVGEKSLKKKQALFIYESVWRAQFRYLWFLYDGIFFIHFCSLPTTLFWTNYQLILLFKHCLDWCFISFAWVVWSNICISSRAHDNAIVRKMLILINGQDAMFMQLLTFQPYNRWISLLFKKKEHSLEKTITNTSTVRSIYQQR